VIQHCEVCNFVYIDRTLYWSVGHGHLVTISFDSETQLAHPKYRVPNYTSQRDNQQTKRGKVK